MRLGIVRWVRHCDILRSIRVEIGHLRRRWRRRSKVWVVPLLWASSAITLVDFVIKTHWVPFDMVFRVSRVVIASES